MILNNPKERSRFLRFAVVGAFGSVIDFGVFNLLATLLGIPAVLASIISFTLAVCSNFIFNRIWTYPDSRSKAVHHQMLQFAMISVIGLGIRTPLFAWSETTLYRLFSEMVLPSSLTARFLGHNIALAIAIGVVMLWNFFANRFWTYADVK